MSNPRTSPAARVAAFFVDSKLTPLLLAAALLLGGFALLRMPREEEPQIRVPFVDVFIALPGAASAVVAQRVTTPVEELLQGIPGVTHTYSISTPGMSLITVRFQVGLKVQDSLTRVYTKLYAHLRDLPAGAAPPVVKLRSIYDVPVLALTLSGGGGERLREVAVALRDNIKRVPDVSTVSIIGGRRRELRVTLNSSELAAYRLTPSAVAAQIGAANGRRPSGALIGGDREAPVSVGRWIGDARQLGQVVVGVHAGMPVLLDQVARVEDTAAEPAGYARIVLGAGAGHTTPPAGEPLPAVTLTIAKRQGTNAIQVVDAVLARVHRLDNRLIPAGVHITVTRNYGRTAEERSNELLEHMGLATISVVLLIGFVLGWREAGVAGVAIPITLLLALFLFYVLGYTLNRITLFALIFSIGILVDDAIVVVENMVRHFRLPQNRARPRRTVAMEAVGEVGDPTILATWTVIAALLPMAFVGGLMGPYMRPIPIGASAAMLLSLAVAFIVTPWATMRLVPQTADPGAELPDSVAAPESALARFYRRGMLWLFTGRRRWGFLAVLALLLLGALSLFYFKLVLVKMLPYDNKTELEVVLHMPETTPLEQTQAVAQRMALYLARQRQVTNVEFYSGLAAPYNFNGLVRHYFLRRQPNQADLQVNLLATGQRSRQSHALALMWRPALDKIAAAAGGRVTVAEIPPGPPVLQTLVAEIYGPTAAARLQIAHRVERVMTSTPGVVDVNWYEPTGTRYELLPRDRKAALSGVSLPELRADLALAQGGMAAGWAHRPGSRQRIPIWLQWPRSDRAGLSQLSLLRVPSRLGGLVSLGELVRTERRPLEPTIFHKDLRPVDYVVGDVAGGAESPGYAIFNMNRRLRNIQTPSGHKLRIHLFSPPSSVRHSSLKWGGEWSTTVRVFRDLGLAFGMVLLLIYVLVVAWFRSYSTPLVILALIPLTLAGIVPAHALLGAYFTATSMIGFIAGAGIVVRNSIILVDFIELRRHQGMSLRDAAIDAGAVRFRPILLTAAAVVVGASVILTDPIFQGLAISLMAGEIAAMIIAPVAIPVLYVMVEGWKPATPGAPGIDQRPEAQSAVPTEAVI